MKREQPPLRYALDLRESRGSAHEVERATARGELVRVRRGAYADPETWATTFPEYLHLATVEAAERAARGPLVLMLESAAAVWGIPVIGPWPSRVQVAVRSTSRTTGPVARHIATLDPHEVTQHHGRTVTTSIRTALDLAASRNFLSGVAAFDHVRRHLGVTLDELTDAIDRRGAFRGVRNARRALAASTGLADSALESALMARLVEFGAPAPEQQWPFVDSKGVSRYGDVRWLLADGSISAAETDGRNKYEDPAMLAGRSADGVVWEEKAREDDLRTHCDRFARIYWTDVIGVTGLIRKLDRLHIPRRPLRARTFAPSTHV